MIDPQAVVKLGAGSGVRELRAPIHRGPERSSPRCVGSPQLLHGRPIGLNQALAVMRVQ
jgi:hypothetical protein